MHRVVCPFTPQLLLVLINRPRKDGTLSWRWYTAATGGSRTRDLAIAKSGTVPLGNRVPDLHLRGYKVRMFTRAAIVCCNTNENKRVNNGRAADTS